MPYKDEEKQRAAQAMWYQNNKQRIINKQRLRRTKIRQFILDYKTENSVCQDCGISYPPHVLDFDHLDPIFKKFTIGESAATNRSYEEILEEIEKCEIVCANCHRHRTFMRRFNGDTGSPDG